VFLVAVAFILLRTMGAKTEGAGEATALDAGAAKLDAGLVEVTMLYSTEKREWIEGAAIGFRKEHPEIKLNLMGKGSISAGESIVEEKDMPTIFSPADTMILSMAAADWKTKGRGDLFALEGEDAPESLVITPIVWVVWEDRADVLLKASKGQVTWKTLHKAIASNQGWPAIGGKPAWGFVKLGQTDPTLSNSGLFALYLMTLEYYAKPTVEIGDLLKPDYQTWVKEIEKGVTKFETSTGTFMTDMVRFGPSKYDISVVYENLAISQIENAQGRWGNLKVYYPQTTLWSDHPAAILATDWVTEPQRQAARKWLAYLRSRPIQEKALALGFRPGDTSIPVKTGDAQNPWTRLAQYGIQVEIPPVAKTPDGAVARNLMTMWRRLVATDTR
jgi:hypothetical protein